MSTHLTATLSRLQHDLGKYVFFETRWLPADADEPALRAALVADVLRTQRTPRGERSAAELWEAFLSDAGPAVEGWRALPSFSDLQDAMVRLADVAEALRDEGAALANLRDGVAATRRVSEAVRRFVAEAREQGEDRG